MGRGKIIRRRGNAAADRIPNLSLGESRQVLTAAVTAARSAGELMRMHFHRPKKIHSQSQHDIKLELDTRCQERITRLLRRQFPDFSIVGEEGTTGDQGSAYRWVVDPIDGTVNFTYGVPHCCVCIALQRKSNAPATLDGYKSIAAVVYDPFCDELWTASSGQPARLNGRIIHVSNRRKLEMAMVSVGFAKYRETLNQMLPLMRNLVHRVRKIRIMGSAALSLTYVATGRMDAYAEYGVRLWDIAAGGFIVECAGGDFYYEQMAGEHTYHIIANNGFLRKAIQRLSS